MNTLHALLQYPEFRQLLSAASWLCWLAASGMALILVIHTMALLGARTFMYKNAPERSWSKRFYPACLALICLLASIALLLAGSASI